MADSATMSPHVSNSQPKARVFTCTRGDSLRTVVEKLSVPGVRRLLVVVPEHRRLEGLITVSDVASFLLL